MEEATRDALKKYLTDEASYPALKPITKQMLRLFLYADENKGELEALREAEECRNPEKLAELVETEGMLRTPDARAYVAARVRGEIRKPGSKLTEENVLRRIRLFMEVNDYMHICQEGQAHALRRAQDVRISFVERAFEIYANSHAGEEPVGEKRDFLDRLSAEAESGLRDDFKKGRAELRGVLESLGFSIGPALQVKNKGGDTE